MRSGRSLKLFSELPTEVLEEVYSNLSTLELIEMSKVSRYYYVTAIYNIFRKKIDFDAVRFKIAFLEKINLPEGWKFFHKIFIGTDDVQKQSWIRLFENYLMNCKDISWGYSFRLKILVKDTLLKLDPETYKQEIELTKKYVYIADDDLDDLINPEFLLDYIEKYYFYISEEGWRCLARYIEKHNSYEEYKSSLGYMPKKYFLEDQQDFIDEIIATINAKMLLPDSKFINTIFKNISKSSYEILYKIYRSADHTIALETYLSELMISLISTVDDEPRLHYLSYLLKRLKMLYSLNVYYCEIALLSHFAADLENEEQSHYIDTLIYGIVAHEKISNIACESLYKSRDNLTKDQVDRIVDEFRKKSLTIKLGYHQNILLACLINQNKITHIKWIADKVIDDFFAVDLQLELVFSLIKRLDKKDKIVFLDKLMKLSKCSTNIFNIKELGEYLYEYDKELHARYSREGFFDNDVKQQAQVSNALDDESKQKAIDKNPKLVNMNFYVDCREEDVLRLVREKLEIDVSSIHTVEGFSKLFENLFNKINIKIYLSYGIDDINNMSLIFRFLDFYASGFSAENRTSLVCSWISAIVWLSKYEKSSDHDLIHLNQITSLFSLIFCKYGALQNIILEEPFDDENPLFNEIYIMLRMVKNINSKRALAERESEVVSQQVNSSILRRT